MGAQAYLGEKNFLQSLIKTKTNQNETKNRKTKQNTNTKQKLLIY